MAEIFDNDLHNYLKKLADDDESALNDDTLNCDLWNKSGCCNAPFWGESDVCSACKEHASVACDDCEDFDICNNPNKPLTQF